jgi:hypothetical protein
MSSCLLLPTTWHAGRVLWPIKVSYCSGKRKGKRKRKIKSCYWLQHEFLLLKNKQVATSKVILMEARVPDLPKGSDIRRFGEVATQIDPASERHVQNPAITAPRLLRLSTGVARPTSPRRLIIACESKNTSKNKEECNTIADV